MSDSRSISPTLVLSAGKTACRACGHQIAEAGARWKEHAVLDERPLGKAGGAMFESGGDVLLRRFYCPACGTTLDAETALPGEPFLVDQVDWS
jgi:acetone carboxylase gamma subunit